MVVKFDPLDVHDIAAVAGIVTFAPDVDVAQALENASPFVVYPVPLVICVPAAEPVDAVLVSSRNIAPVFSAVSWVPGIPPEPTGSSALSISDERAASTAVCAMT